MASTPPLTAAATGRARRSVGQKQDRIAAGDAVVLFGAQGSQRITQAEFEAAGNGDGPELLAMLAAGLPRVLAVT